MGFAWSSFVAQSALTGVCERAALTRCKVLASEVSIPSDLSVASAVATADFMIFSDGALGTTINAAHEVERVMSSFGIVKNPEKDIDDAIDAPCAGVDLVDGRFWFPPSELLWRHLDAEVDLAGSGVGFRGGVAGFIGGAQWFDLLRRLRLSVFDHTYAFSAGQPSKD